MSNFSKKGDLASLKSDINKLDTDKLEKVPSDLNSLKSKVDYLDADKLKPPSKDFFLKKIDVVNKQDLDIKSRDVENRIPDVSALVSHTGFNTKIEEVEKKNSDDSKHITATQRN